MEGNVIQIDNDKCQCKYKNEKKNVFLIEILFGILLHIGVKMENI